MQPKWHAHAGAWVSVICSMSVVAVYAAEVHGAGLLQVAYCKVAVGRSNLALTTHALSTADLAAYRQQWSGCLPDITCKHTRGCYCGSH